MLRIYKLYSNSRIPDKSYAHDAGFNLYSPDSYIIKAGKVQKIPLGISIYGENGIMYLIQERSSMALKGIFTIGNVIDSGYTGEISVILLNSSDDRFEIKEGDKIAQLIQVKIADDDEIVQPWNNSEQLPSRQRNGYGSSGK